MLALMIPLIAGSGFIGPLVTLLFLCAAAYIIWWGFSKIALPEPFRTLILVVVGLVFLFVLWQVLAPMVGSG